MLSPIESQAIGLRVAADALSSCVNHALLEVSETAGEAIFKSNDHHQLFSVRILDLLEKVDANLTGVPGSCLDLLAHAADASALGPHCDPSHLRAPLTKLREWLDDEIPIPVWFPSIEFEGDLVIARHDMLYIAGNISKHNLARLTRTSIRLAKVLKRSGRESTDLDAALTLDDFYERFHDDILVYYGTWIVELLNNVWWGLYRFLRPEFERSFTRVQVNSPRYEYQYPENLHQPFARSCYWDLMNTLRSPPPIPRFEADPIWKRRYSSDPSDS